jgi:hypothetical protein
MMQPGISRVILAYKNFAANRAVSHIGLGVTALNTAKSLRTVGVTTDVWAITSSQNLSEQLQAAAAVSPVSHVVVSAPWIPTSDLQRLTAEHPETKFAVNCHSNLGFLQADPGAMRLVREGLELQRTTWNFQVAANNQRLCNWVADTYGNPCIHIPNLYHLDELSGRNRTLFSGGTLRIGAFGATRPLKNFMTAAGAALEIAARMRVDLEFWMSSGRNEGAGPLVNAIQQMATGLPHVRVMENGWQTWPQFRQTVRHMHLLLQPSYTETFNVVTADGIAEGVPSVVSHAIEWAPEGWKAQVDDVHQIAATGEKLLHDKRASRRGLKALQTYNKRALRFWNEFMAS